MMTKIMFWLPIAMVSIGTIWLSIRQVRSGDKATAMSAKILETGENSLRLLAEAAAREGNEKLRAELIETRTKLAIAGAQGSTKTVETIIAQLPQLTENQRRLNEEKKNTVEKIAIDFELSWTAFINSALAMFDGRIDDIKHSGIELSSLDRQAMPSLTIIAPGPDGNYQIRSVSSRDGKVRVTVIFSRAVLFQGSMLRPAILVFRVDDRSGIADINFEITMNSKEVSSPLASIKKSNDGLPTAEMKHMIESMHAKVIERFLVLASLEK